MELSLDIVLAGDQAADDGALSRMLAGLGHRVLARATGGVEACRLCRELKPDLALLNVRLTGLDGIEAAGRVMRQRPLPVVLISDRADPDFLRRANAAGVCGYLTEPVDSELLGPSLAVAVHTFERERRLRGAVADLKAELQSRKLIARAQGILMEQRGISLDEAAQRIVCQAEKHGLSPAQVARGIIATREIARAPRP